MCHLLVRSSDADSMSILRTVIEFELQHSIACDEKRKQDHGPVIATVRLRIQSVASC